MWLYGCGFPKSMDISKQLEKKDKDLAKQWKRIWYNSQTSL